MIQKKKTISFYTLGCRLNQSETAVLEHCVEAGGFTVVDFNTSAWNELLSEIKKIAQKENAVFVRIEPRLPKNTEIKFPDFRPAYATYQPHATLKLNLTLSEEELQKQMKPKGRYNISLARKKGVEIVDVSSNEASLDVIPAEAGIQSGSRIKCGMTNIFYKLVQETTDRDRFSPHSEGYYRNFLKVLNGEDLGKMYLAKFDGQSIAGILVTFFGNEATYYYGASGSEHRNLMAPYLLQWQAILDAKKRGFQKYDLFGIAPLDVKNHPWAGVTEFKLKFGGEVYEYQNPLEYVLKPLWYWGIKMAKRVLKMVN